MADPGVRLLVPLEGAPTLDSGAFVALPGGRISVGQEWLATEEDRPPITWRAVGREMMGGNSCIKLVGEQKSDDWDRPRADRAAWHRQDTVWLVPTLGLAYRVEREIAAARAGPPGSHAAERVARRDGEQLPVVGRGWRQPPT